MMQTWLSALILLFWPHPTGAKAATLTSTRIAGGAKDGSDVAALVRAIEQQRQTRRPSRIVLTGTFHVRQTIRLTADNAGLIIESDFPNTAQLVAIGVVARGIEIRRAEGVRIAGLKLRGFAQDGILASDTTKIVIEGNTIEETRSDGWSQAAIHLTGTVTSATVRDNIVRGADYAGILVDTIHTSDVSKVRIIGNQVGDTCRRVYDCGAIYVNDRGRRSRDILIANNQVMGFGPVSVGGRAIYVDDWASHVTVRKNHIAGPGRFAFQIHGGRDNRIEGNTVQMRDISTLLLYQPAVGGTRAQMTGNHFKDNHIVSVVDEAATITPADRKGEGAIAIGRNRMYSGRSHPSR